MPYAPEENRKYLRKQYDAQRRFFIELLGGKCRKCGATTRLEVDHIDAETKTMHLGKLFTKRTIVAALVELTEKCQLLCRACHIEKSRVEARGERGFTHGSMYGWMTRKCQCQVCLQEKWAWHDKRNAARRRGEPYETKRARGVTAAAAASNTAVIET